MEAGFIADDLSCNVLKLIHYNELLTPECLTSASNVLQCETMRKIHRDHSTTHNTEGGGGGGGTDRPSPVGSPQRFS